MIHIISLIKAFWQQRNQREQIMLWTMLVVVGAAIWYQFILVPSFHYFRHGHDELPKLAAHVQQMAVLRGEVDKWRASPVLARQSPSQLRQNSLQVLKSVSADSSSLQISVVDALTVHLKASMRFDQWLVTMDHLTRDYGITILSVSMGRHAANGTVTIDADLTN